MGAEHPYHSHAHSAGGTGTSKGSLGLGGWDTDRLVDTEHYCGCLCKS